MESTILWQELTCSVCMSTYKDPTTLPCGHTFCTECIHKTARTSFTLLCPECRCRVPEVNRLLRNTKMCNILEHLTSPRAGKNAIHQCFNCDDIAEKLCLDCEVPLCSKHLKRHKQLVQHIVTDLDTPVHSRKCPVHKEVLRYECMEDGVYICASCGLFGDHTGHTLQKLCDLSNKEKDVLRLVEEQLATKKAEDEKTIDLVKKHKSAQTTKADTIKNQVTGFIRDLKKELEEVEHKILCEITKEEEKIVDTESEVVQALKAQIAEMCVQKEKIQSLNDCADPITVLSSKQSVMDRANDLLFPDVNLFVRHLDEDLISVNVLSCLRKFTKSLPLIQKKRGFHVQDATFTSLPMSNVSIDLPGSLVLTLDGRNHDTLWSTTSTVSLSSGQHYWEVETSDMPCWAVGVSYAKDNDWSTLGRTSGSWCLRLEEHMQYKAALQNQEVAVSTDHSVKALAVYLDYDAGKLSFYQLSNAPKLLCSMNAKFTQPLYFTLGVSQSGFLKITR